MDRGQAEIVGLLIIVMLITVGFLFYVRFVLYTEGNLIVDAHEETQLGQTFVNSLAVTDVTCGSRRFSVESMIRDIAAGRAGSAPCDMAQELDAAITAILDETLRKWGVNYRLWVARRVSGQLERVEEIPEYNNTLYEPAERCSAYKDRTLDFYLIQLYPLPQAVELRLEQCE